MRGIIAIGALCVLTSTAVAEVELKNDSFNSGDTVGFQAGFVIGEIGASRFVAPEAGRQLLKVRLLFGGLGTSTTTRDVTLKIYDDSAGIDSPGTELDSEDFTLTNSDSAFSEITLANTVTVPVQFRVGIQFQHAGLPSIARDVGPINASKNYMFAIPGGWMKSQAAGLTGDWIIRAVISDGAGGTPDAAPGSPDASPAGTPDAAPAGTPDAAPVGGACNGNSECPVGQYCDTAAHACTLDCREDVDCSGGNTCNSLGQCIEGGGGGGCQTDGGGGGGHAALLLGLGALTLFIRRRR